MNANLASIMPQVIAVWCEEAGHDVRYVCYTGFEDLASVIPSDTDLLFIGTFSESAQLAYAISALYRAHGTVTAIGGPHARCYPEDAALYFDYVFGFTDRTVVDEVLRDCAPHAPLGVAVGAARQPVHLPGVRERWKFVAETLKVVDVTLTLTWPLKVTKLAIGPPTLMVPVALPVTEVLPPEVATVKSAAIPVTLTSPFPRFTLALSR